MSKAVFLDRDGTIIEDRHYPRNPDEVAWVSGAKEGLKKIIEKGYQLFVVSNQSGVGRGIISDKEFRAVHDRFCELMKESGIEIREFAYCFHKPEDRCSCRKPSPDLVKEMVKAHSIDLKASFSVGDRPCDVQLGQALGGTGLLVLSGKGAKSQTELKASETPVPVFSSLLEVADFLPDAAG